MIGNLITKIVRELKRGSSTLSQRSTHFAGARELQKLRNSTARQDIMG
jgi:hypothetical protein